MKNSTIAQKSDLVAISKATEQDSTDDPTTSTAEDNFKYQAALTFLGRDLINKKIGSGSAWILGNIEEDTIKQSKETLLSLLANPSAMECLLLSHDSANRLNQIRGKIQPKKEEASVDLAAAQQHKFWEIPTRIGSQIPDAIRAFLRKKAPRLMATASTRDHINDLLKQSDFSGTARAQDALLTIADLGFVNLLTDLDENEQNRLLENYSTLLKKRGLRTALSRLLVYIVPILLVTASITPALVWIAGIFLPEFQISAMTSNILMISALSCIGLSLISGLIGWYLSHTGIEPLLSKLESNHPEMIELAAKIGVVEPKLIDRLEAEYQKHDPSVKKYRSRIRWITRALGVPMIIASIPWAIYLLTPLMNHTQNVHTFISTITPSSLIVIGSLLCIGAVILGIGQFSSRALELKQLKARAQKMCPRAYTQFIEKKEAHQSELNSELNSLYASIKTAVDKNGLATRQALNPGNVELFNYQITHEKQRFQEGLNEYLMNDGYESLDDISYNEATGQWVVTIQKTGQAHYYATTDGAYLEPSDELKATQAMQLFLYRFEQQLTSQEPSTKEKLDATWTQFSKEFSDHADTIKARVLHNPKTALQWMQENLKQRLEWHFITFVEQIGKDSNAFDGFLLTYRAMTTNTEKTDFIKQLKGREEISQEALNTLDTYQVLSELKEKHSSILHATIAEDHRAAVQALAQYLTQENATLTADQIECLKSIQGSQFLNAQLTTELQARRPSIQAYLQTQDELKATQALTDLNEHDRQQELDKKTDSIQAWLIRKGSSETPEQLEYLIDRYTSDREGTLEVIVEDVQDGLSPSFMALLAIQKACESEEALTLTQDQYHALSNFNATELEKNLTRVTGYQNRGNLIQEKGGVVYFKDVPLIGYTETGREALEAISKACNTGSAPTLTQAQYDALYDAHLTHDAAALNTALRVMTNCQNSGTLIQKMGVFDNAVGFNGVPLIQYTDTACAHYTETGREALEAISKACNTGSAPTLTQAQYDALYDAHLTHDAAALNTALRVMTNCQNSGTLIQKMGVFDNAVSFNGVALTTCIETELVECPPLNVLSAAALAPSQTTPTTAGIEAPVQSSETSVNDTPHL